MNIYAQQKDNLSPIESVIFKPFSTENTEQNYSLVFPYIHLLIALMSLYG